MKRILTFLLIALIAGSASAQKFGHINTAELISVMPERDSAMKKMEAFSKDLQEIFEGMQVEFNKKVADFEKNQATWSEAIKGAKQKELVDMQRRLQEQNQVSQDDLEKEQQKYIAPIQEKMRATIAKVAKAQGLIYVFDIAGGAISYFNPEQSMDVLPLVKKEMKITK